MTTVVVADVIVVVVANVVAVKSFRVSRVTSRQRSVIIRMSSVLGTVQLQPLSPADRQVSIRLG